MRRLGWFLRRPPFDDGVAEELALHRELKVRELRDRGVGEAEIAAAVQRAMGNELAARQRARDVWVWPWLQDVSQDVRFGVRMLVRERRFTAAAVVALALGIAVSNSVFTAVNAAIWKDLAFDRPDQLIETRLLDARGRPSGIAYRDFQTWRDVSRDVVDLGATLSSSVTVSDAERPAERWRGVYASGRTFDTLGVAAALGRGFAPADDRPGAPAVAVVAYDAWQNRYGGDPGLLGRVLRINQTPTTVVGVMPPGFGFPTTPELWLPLTMFKGLAADTRVNVFGRLHDESALPRVRGDLETLFTIAAAERPDSYENTRITTSRVREGGLTGSGPLLMTLLGAVGFVMLIACANVTNLLLARSAHRAREVALRASLGATRWRIARQLLVECALMALAAGVLGYGLSILGADAIAGAFDTREIASPTQTTRPYWVDLSTDGMGWVFLAGLCLFASLGIGLLPSWHACRADVTSVLKSGGRAGGVTRSARRWTAGLIVAELALTLVLLTGAGLLIRGFFSLYLQDLVIDTRAVVTTRLSLPADTYSNRAQQAQFVRRLGDRIAALPVFLSFTLASDIPLMPLSLSSSRRVEIGGRVHDESDPPTASVAQVDARYFETLKFPIVRGRGLSERDDRPGEYSAVVNQRFAAIHFPEGEPIGHQLRLTVAADRTAPSPWLTIVGVVPSLPNFRPAQAEDPVVYIPMGVDIGPLSSVSLIARTPDSPAGRAAAVAAMREHVAALDPNLPLYAVQTLDDAVAVSRWGVRTVGAWFLILAAIALVLPTVGVYAITAHGVAQAAPEIGVRMAMGARPAQVVWLFVRKTMVQLTVGLSVGLAGAVTVGSFLAMFLGGTDPRDPLTLALVVILLVGVALTASAWPARRAARVDPATVLRAE